jgi:hypothetical protein
MVFSVGAPLQTATAQSTIFKQTARPHFLHATVLLLALLDRCRFHDSATNDPFVRSHQLFRLKNWGSG